MNGFRDLKIFLLGRLSLGHLYIQTKGCYEFSKALKFNFVLLITTSYTYSWNPVVTYIYAQKSKGKLHPCTGTEALYRPYGP
jgi:hypothetical protein